MVARFRSTGPSARFHWHVKTLPGRVVHRPATTSPDIVFGVTATERLRLLAALQVFRRLIDVLDDELS
jgi:hypothetical protein